MVPAMVTRLSGEDGLVNQDITDRYVRYAQGGAGLIVVEAMAVHHAKSGPLLRISDDQFVPGLADLARRIHDTSDSKVVPQIIHFLKVAKSGWRQTVDMLSLEEIDRIVEEFGDAVARAREAGFDGAELHSAHAYTLASFLSRANPRKDDYGGDTLEGRLRLIGRVLENIRRKVGDGLSGRRSLPCRRVHQGRLHGQRRQADRAAAGRSSARPICRSRSAASSRMRSICPGRCCIRTPATRAIAACRATGIRPCRTRTSRPRSRPSSRPHGFDTPVATAGKISDPDDAERLIATGEVDIVGIARGLLADPDWANKVRSGERDRIVTCDYCNVCKHLDGTHMRVICALWPQGSLQAPPDDRAADAPRWGAPGADLAATAQRRQGRVEVEQGDGRRPLRRAVAPTRSATRMSWTPSR